MRMVRPSYIARAERIGNTFTTHPPLDPLLPLVLLLPPPPGAGGGGLGTGAGGLGIGLGGRIIIGRIIIIPPGGRIGGLGQVQRGPLQGSPGHTN